MDSTPHPPPRDFADDLATTCPLCASSQLERVYERRLGTASALGRRWIRLELCGGCGLLFQNPRPSREVLEEHYRSSAAASGAVWHEEGADSARGLHTAARAAFVARLLRATPTPGRVLDVGCGGGELLAALAEHGATRCGLEPNAHAAARARAQGIEVAEATLEGHDLPCAAFDLVMSISCLEHVGDVHASVTALARLVTPGGLLFVEVPDSCRPLAQAAEFFSIEHLTHFTMGTLYRLLVRHGFAPILGEHAADGPAVRVGARYVGEEAAAWTPIPDEGRELREALRHYRRQRAAFEEELSGRLRADADRWRQNDARIAIFGAGDHTRFLLDMVDLTGCVAAILDGDPAKHGTRFRGWPVHAPEDLPRLGVTAVVLSSRPFQEEMAARIAAACADHGVELVRCYPAARAA